jgi:cytochrome c553
MTIKNLLTLASMATFAAVLALPFASAALAEDLSDNATCMECHADEPRAAPENTDRPRVHTDEGGFNVEDHEMWSCIDCHDMITNCHDSTPTME